MKNVNMNGDISLEIVTETQEEYDMIKKAAGFLESMFECEMNTPWKILWGIKKVLRERKVHKSVKDFFGEARRLIFKYNGFSGWPFDRDRKEPYHNQQRRVAQRRYPHVAHDNGRERHNHKIGPGSYGKQGRRF